MSKNTFVRSYRVRSLPEFYDAVQRINEAHNVRVTLVHEQTDAVYEGDVWPLWYRGQEQSDYVLLPTLFRNAETTDELGAFGEMHLREELRRHAFQARAQHSIRTNPVTRSDWQEIMQHHLMGTRMMDWSETVNAALIFALEAYLDPREDEHMKRRRQRIDPVVWVLDPARLNRKVFRAFMDRKSGYRLIRNALDDYILAGRGRTEVTWRIVNMLKHDKWFARPDEKKASHATLGLINLSSVETMRRDAGPRLRDMLMAGEFNPFFYLLARYFCDGVPVDLSSGLPPLATMHPYHSDRIAAQHGAFTCYPYYRLNAAERDRKLYITDPRAMEEQANIQECLYEIHIVRPEHVAAQLIDSGARISHLYPELERYAKDLEATNFHI